MNTRKNKVFPIILTVIIISIIVYLFSNIKQPYVVCSKNTSFDKNIKYKEKVKTTLDNNKISKLEVEKKIVLPEELSDKKHIKNIKLALKEAYKYLGKNHVKITNNENIIKVKINIDKHETVIINDININYNDDIVISIVSNTKSSDVVSLKIKDKYTEGSLITRLRNYGYSCK